MVHDADEITARAEQVAGLPGMDVGGVATGNGGHGRRTQKASERVALQIVGDIVARGLRTGDRLPLEAAMVTQYGVSRASLREALRLLEVQGMIHLKPGPGGGPVIGAVSPAHLSRTVALYFQLARGTYGQLMAAQVLLEPLCAGLAAEHPDRARELERFLDDGVSTTDGLEYREATGGFHATVWRLADNPVLTLLTQALTQLVTDHVVATMDPVELRPSILAEHVELAQVMIEGDVAEAQRLTAVHFQAQHDYYRQHWPARLEDVIEWRW